MYATGTLEDDGRAGQDGVDPKKPGGRAAHPQLANEHGKRGAGKGEGEADERPQQYWWCRRALIFPCALVLHQSALLEEQKSVMQHCTEERRRLAAEWAHFHTLEKQRRERAEREVGSLLEKREGSIMSLAQVSFTPGISKQAPLLFQIYSQT